MYWMGIPFPLGMGIGGALRTKGWTLPPKTQTGLIFLLSLKLGVGDLLGGDLDQSGSFPGAGGKGGTEVSPRLKRVNLR